MRRRWSDYSSICFSRRIGQRRARSPSISMPPMIRCMASRKGASFMATTNPIVFCGRHLLCAKLRRSDIDASAGSVEEVARIVAQIRGRWPKVRILLRADSGFTRDDLMTWCEQNDVDYLFGLAKNDRLIAEIAAELAEAAEENRQSGKPARRFRDFQYRTRKSWSRQRRVVGKAEWMIPSVAESESATKPRRKKKSIKVGDI